MSGTAAERRRSSNLAIVSAHPRWHGIRHPELIPFPPRRFSQLDMLPAVEHSRAWPATRRAERTREIVAAHPRWHGIRHPERIVFPERVDPLLAYRAAVRVARQRVRESEELCAHVAAVAAAFERRPWPWSASPARLAPEPSRAGSPRAIRRDRRRPEGRARARPAGRLLAH